jgi:hypothetical protein
MTKALIIEFLIESWLEFYLSRHGDDEKLDDTLLVESFSGLRPVQSNWTMIVRGLQAGCPEFDNPEIRAALLEYLNRVELVVDQPEWRRLINEVQFSTLVQGAAPTPSVTQEHGLPSRGVEDVDEYDEDVQPQARQMPATASGAASMFKKPEVRLPVQDNRNILNYYSVFMEVATQLKISADNHVILFESGLDKRTSETFRLVKASTGAVGKDEQLGLLVRKTAELMGVGSKVLSIQELHNLAQGPHEEAWSFHNRFTQVLLRYRLFNGVIEEDLPFWFLSKLRNVDDIELKLGDQDYSIEKIVTTANKVQKGKRDGRPKIAPSGDDKKGISNPRREDRTAGIVCYNCKGRGHKAADCTKKAEEKPRDKRNRAQDNGYASIYGDVGGVRMEIMLDSCAGTSVISRDQVELMDVRSYTVLKVCRSFLWGTTRVECTRCD